MSATFDVLVPGYVREDTDGTEHVRGTVSLIRSADLVMVADRPGHYGVAGRTDGLSRHARIVEIADGVSIMLTPGHSAECASLIVETDDKGTVVYTHAWWLSDMTPVEDPMAEDQRELEASRAKILAIADVIVRAHGEPFEAPK